MITESSSFSQTRNEEEERALINFRKLDRIDYALRNGKPGSGYRANKGELSPLTPGQIVRSSTEFDRVAIRVYKDLKGKSVEEIVEIIEAAGVSRELISTLAEHWQEYTSKKIDKPQRSTRSRR